MSRKKNWEKKKKFSKGKQIKNDRFKLKKRDLREFEKQGLIKEGTFIGNQKGFGFVELEDEEDDIFIPANSVGTAMHQDNNSQRNTIYSKNNSQYCSQNLHFGYTS